MEADRAHHVMVEAEMRVAAAKEGQGARATFRSQGEAGKDSHMNPKS